VLKGKVVSQIEEGKRDLPVATLLSASEEVTNIPASSAA
jgi:hypothetical protein